MFKKIGLSLKHFNYKMFFSLLVLGLCPTIYTTIRIYFVGQLPSEYAYSIAGQLQWVNLTYEILSETIILPLFYFIGQVLNDKKELNNRVRTGLLITFITFLLFSIIIIAAANPLLRAMATSTDILDGSTTYIRIESIATLFTMLANFTLIILITLNKEIYVYIITLSRLILSILFDVFLVSTLPISANLGVNGIGISNILTSILLLIISIILLHKENVKVFAKEKLNFTWSKEFFKIGGISGLESLVRNIAYIIMISRMVNVVNEQGTYWVANSFIWGWLLLPILQLAELIKKDCASDENTIKNNTVGYLTVTLIICVIWCMTIPAYKPFFTNVLKFDDVDKLYDLVVILLGFYILFAFQNIFDSTFYGIGKTNYMLFESIITNTIYYGIAFILYITKTWIPTLTGIALMFGIGMAFDSIVSLTAYIYLLKKRHINILNIE